MEDSRACRYCMAPVEPPRRSFCCSAHARAFARQESRARDTWTRWLARNRRAKQQQRLSEARWRKVALGVDVETQIALIFNRKGSGK